MIEVLNEMGRTWAEYIIPALVQNTVFLALVFLALHWFRNASASVKYVIAAVGLVKLLLPPFVPTSLFVAAAEPVAFPASNLLFSFSNLTAGAGTGPPSTPAGLDLFGALFIVWALVALFVLSRAVRATVRLASRVRDARPITGEPSLRSATSRDCRNIGVFKAPHIGIPLTMGVHPHRIFVPDAWDDWTQECRTAVLKHEIAHIHRRDGLFQTLEIIAQALYFFHPLVWMLNRRLRAYREMACDDASVGRDHRSRLTYSRYLVELAETALRPPVACESASTLMRKKHELLARVAYQVKEGDMLSLNKKKLAVVMAALVIAILPFSMYLTNGEVIANNVAAAGVSGEQEAKQAPPEKQKFTKIGIVIKSDALAIDDKKVSDEEFAKYLTMVAGDNPDNVVALIQCGDDVSMARLYKVQRQLMTTGITKVAYTDGNGHQMAGMLPDDDVKKKMEKISKDDVAYVVIKASGTIEINKQPVKPEKLAKVFAKMLDDNPNLILSIHADEKARYKDVVHTFAMAKEAGAERILINNPVS
jgi:beta-lactamase regulating signal transducer with metallopeptidase domain